MNKTEMLADRLREIAREYKCAPRTLIQAADMIENQARNIEALQASLETERNNHDRLQDWDRGLTEQGEVLKRLINGEWVDSCDVEAALGLTFAECVKRFEMNRIATWNPYPLNGQRVDVQFRIKKGDT